MTVRMCRTCGDWHDLDEPWPCARPLSASSAPNVISDNMGPLKHHGTGRIIDSKRAFARETRAAGCVEIGNEPIKPRPAIPLDRRARREAIQQVIHGLRNS